MRIGETICSGLVGLRANPVAVEAFVSQGLPSFTLIGLPDASLGEARERVRSAIAAAGYPWPQTRVTVNLAPAGMAKHGTAYDLAIALAILAAGRWMPPKLSDILVLGELNLDGAVLPVKGLLPSLLDARERGIRKAVVPRENLQEAQLVPGIDLVLVDSLAQAVRQLGGRAGKRPPVTLTARAKTSHCRSGESCVQAGQQETTDLAEIIGQEQAKRALEVAAAGGHHLLMTGPPGAGKSLLARALPGLLPPLDKNGQLEVASIRSICGTLPRYGMSEVPPFEAPHHTASASALVGGGVGMATPGAITRAHLGVLFLDEAPEFSSSALQALREPLETGEIVLARSKAETVYPAKFLLVMAANPCPCGNDWGDGRLCTCSVSQRRRYWSRLSGPLLDRIDIQIEVPPLDALPSRTSAPPESSSHVRQRVCEARARAAARYRAEGWSCNAQASGKWLRNHTAEKALRPLQQGIARHTVSMRGADRALRLAWTIADLGNRTSPSEEDVAEALVLRTRRS